jgi:hypothetical protein
VYREWGKGILRQDMIWEMVKKINYVNMQNISVEDEEI